MSNPNKINLTYWDKYYGSSGEVPILPSQFCVFVAAEFPDADFVIDLGCGNGRDSFFFARQGHHVVSIDRSATAIQSIQDRKHPQDRLENICLNLSDINAADIIESKLIGKKCGIVYARFFLHAITVEDEALFLRICSKLSSNHDLTVAVEFRTLRDSNLQKETPKHFRRYIDPLEFMRHAAEFGFTTRYFIEGFGYAKYRADDAHVARIFLSL